jgi:hypothetical protein
MKEKAAKTVFSAALVLFSALAFGSLQAQETSATLSGTITDHTGRALPKVKVTIKNATTGQSTEIQTDSDGVFTVSGLGPGDYEISASAAEGANVAHTALAAEANQKVDLVLSTPGTEVQVGTPPAARPDNLPNAPSASKTEPSLDDLGFSKADTQSNSAQQALLDKRTHMLKIHQRMGLITAVPLLATVISSVNAGGRSTSTSSRDLHVALGALTGDLYGITAYYAIRAPRIDHTKKRGPIRFHEAMAWIHGPGMIMTPILGAMAFDQKCNGEKVHGIAQAHGPVAIITAGAFGAALLSVSVKF